MTDDRLRALERRFRETGTVEDEAAWLTERVRAGELSKERLELAASLGHEAAGLALGGGVQAPEDLRALLVGLPDFAKVRLRETPPHLGKQVDQRRLATATLWLMEDPDGDLDQHASAMLGGPRVSKWTRTLVCEALVPWALGYGDPVRDRVEARKAAGE